MQQSKVRWADGKGKYHEGILVDFIYRPDHVNHNGVYVDCTCVGIVLHKHSFKEIERASLEFIEYV